MCGRVTDRLTWEELSRCTGSRLAGRRTISAALQHLPDRPDRRGGREDGKRELSRGALGPGSRRCKAAQGIETGDVQRARRDRREKPFFRDAFKRKRCLIPVSGYYEWQDTPAASSPAISRRATARRSTFAGLWDEWKDPETGEPLKSCTMIITEPNGSWPRSTTACRCCWTEETSTRGSAMPAPSLLKPAPTTSCRRWPVSKRVNSSKAPADDPTLIEQVDLGPELIVKG